MEIIHRSDIPPPILQRTVKPENMTEKEAKLWYAKQHDRWIYGDDYSGMNGAGLPGSLIFFSDVQFIKHRKVRNDVPSIERPMIRDVEFILHHEAAQAVKNHESLLVFKGTGLGLSTFGGAYASYTAITKPGSTSLITSSSTNSMTTIFQEKIIDPMAMYDDDILEKFDEGNRKGQLKTILLNKSKNKCFLKINIKNFKDSSESASSIDCRETSEKLNSPYNFAGSGADYAFVDEFAVHTRKKDVAKALVSRMRDANTREIEGLLLLGGALEINEKDGIDSKDVKELKELIQPEVLKANNMRTLFLPFWYGFNCHIRNGHSDEKGAMEWWEQNAERLAKSPNPFDLRNFIMTNPRTLDDIFSNIKASRFEEEVQEKIIIWRDEVILKDVPLESCNVVFTDKYSFPKGESTKILEHAKQGCRYVFTCDGVQTSETTSSVPESERSKIAMVVTKLDDVTSFPYMPVCTFSEHPKSVERSIYKMIDIIRMYGQFNGLFKINTEINVGFGEFFGAVLDRENLGNFCAMKRDFSTHGFKMTNKRFYYRDDLCKERQYNFANSFLKKYVTSVQMINILDQMLTPMSENCDELDAFLGLFETIPEIGYEKIKKKFVMPQKQQWKMENVNGKIQFVCSSVTANDQVAEILKKFTYPSYQSVKQN